MNRYEFTYTFMKPEGHVYKIIVDANNDLDAYHNALNEIEIHLLQIIRLGLKVPSEMKISCIKKGEVLYESEKTTLPCN